MVLSLPSNKVSMSVCSSFLLCIPNTYVSKELYCIIVHANGLLCCILLIMMDNIDPTFCPIMLCSSINISD